MKLLRSLFKNFLNKENYKIIKIISSIILAIFLSIIVEIFVMEKYLYNYFSIDRVCILTFFIFLLIISLLLEVKTKLYCIYKYRYIFVSFLLIVLVLLGYSGSSINILDREIQNDSTDSSYEEILGVSRSIRSDEWATNTLLSFSQTLDDGSKFSYFSDKLRATSTDMFTVINAPVLDIVSIGKLFNIGYLFGNKIGLSFWWYGRLFALMLTTFELAMILTKQNKKISILGMLLITFSPAVQWWYSNFIADILIWGSLSIVLIDKFMLAEKRYTKVLCLIGLSISIISYIFTFYPAWIISFGYVYIALVIWVIIKNHKTYKINLFDILGIVLALIFIILIGLRYYSLSNETLKINLSTDYPGERLVIGGETGAKSNIFSYIYSMVLPFKSDINPCEKSSMLSFFPLPIILAIVFIIKDKSNRKKNLYFLVPMLIVSTLLTIWTFVVTNELFAKCTFLYMVPCNRGIIPLGFSQILILIYIFGNINKEIYLFSKRQAGILSLSCVSLIFILMYKFTPGLYDSYITEKLLFILIPFNIFIFYLLLSYNTDTKDNQLLYFVLVITSLVSGIFVNPVIKGTNVVYNKPIAKEIRKIVASDRDAIWMTENCNFVKSNYLVANGAKVINCTNYYPNFELYEKILGKDLANNEEKRKIYNRYAHTIFNLDEKESDVSLVALDTVKVDINIDDIKIMNINYILTQSELEKYNNNEIIFEKIYNEYGLYIYKLQY